MNLQNKTFLVTGSSKGIGAAVVKSLSAQGANVIITYNSDKKSAKEVAAIAEQNKVKTMVVHLQIEDENSITEMFRQIKTKFSQIDGLVNNIGIKDAKDDPLNVEAFERTFATNLFGQIRVTKAALGLMKKGKIVFVSSVHSDFGRGKPGSAAYSSSKAAINSYAKNLAKDLAPDILVNIVSPGRTLTPMWGEMDESFKADQAKGHLINRWIKPDEIADGVVFLLKNDAVCGETLTIDGGMSLVTLG